MRRAMEVKSHSKEHSSLSLFLLTNSKTMSNRLTEPRMAVISTLSNNSYSPYAVIRCNALRLTLKSRDLRVRCTLTEY